MISPINSTLPKEHVKRLSKVFGGELIDGSTAKVRLNFNPQGNIQSMECYTFNKKGNSVGGKAIGRIPKLTYQEIIDFVVDISEKAKNWDVVGTFNAVIRK